MKRLSGSNQEIAALLYAEQLELSQQNDNVEEAVAAIIQDVRLRGDEALRHYSVTFDRVELEDFEMGQDLVDQAFEQVDQAVLTALENAKANIVPELNTGQLVGEVERYVGRDRVVSVTRVDGELFEPEEILEAILHAAGGAK